MFGLHARRRIAFFAVFATLLTAGLRFAAPSSGADPPTTYTVQAGDTLWEIAADRGGDPRAGIAAIRGLNDLPDSTIRAGQVLLLP